MNRILGIFRKDVRHLWPQALLFWAVLGMPAAMNHLLKWGLSLTGGAALALQPLACWLLVVSVIHGEALVGHQQYWLTRPYSRKQLVAAKCLFLLVFVNLPLFVYQFAILAGMGIPPLHWLYALLWRQVFFTVFFVLPVAALAAVTRNLGQVLLAGILLGVTIWAGASLTMLIQGDYPDWGGLDWIRDCGTALVVAAGTTVALAMQYSRRRTAVSRAVLAVTLALTMLVMTAPRWGAAFAIQKLFSRERIRDTAVRISFDQSRAGMQPQSWSRSSNDPTGVRLEIPVRVDDVPRGAMVGLDWTSFSLKSPRGTWRSGWLAFQALHDLSQGAAWLTVYVDPSFYNASPDAPVDLDGTLDLTLSRCLRTMPLRWGMGLVPEIGICYFTSPFGSYQLSCTSPFQQASVQMALRSSGFPEQTSQDVANAPFPTSDGFWPVSPVSSASWPNTVDYTTLALMIHRPVAHVQRDFQVRGLVMRQFMHPQR